jgi:hypothetical protein
LFQSVSSFLSSNRSYHEWKKTNLPFTYRHDAPTEEEDDELDAQMDAMVQHFHYNNQTNCGQRQLRIHDNVHHKEHTAPHFGIYSVNAATANSALQHSLALRTTSHGHAHSIINQTLIHMKAIGNTFTTRPYCIRYSDNNSEF